jgi:malate dehydrogenase (oxaloacetate-decarboxylating)
MQTMPKCPVETASDFAVWYTPGVAAPCRDIVADPARVYAHTNKGNLVAVVTDGSRVLGLGNIGPEAGLPVMEGKALLFKMLGGVDAIAIALASQSEDDIVRAVELLAPSFGGINLEDIAQPKCFSVLDRLRRSLAIPVWHDDQQGTATVALAALMNACLVTGKSPDSVRIVLIGVGAANVAVYRLFIAHGIDPRRIIACDRQGTLHARRGDIESARHEFPDKWRICSESNGDEVKGGPAEALRGADICIAFSASGPGVIEPAWIRTMKKGAVVLACANPVPEIWPWDAAEAGAAVVATGRSDFPNQVNNSLVFPGLFRGVLDCRARVISDRMALAAANELARRAQASGLKPDRILPGMDDADAAAEIAAAVAMAAIDDGLAGRVAPRETFLAEAHHAIGTARAAMAALIGSGAIEKRPSA